MPWDFASVFTDPSARFLRPLTCASFSWPGVHYVNVDRLHGKVTVTGSTSQKKVLRAARRTGKLAVLWPSAYNNPAYLHAYVQPATTHYYHQPHRAAAHAQHHRRHYDSDAGVVSAVGRRPPVAQQYHKASSYNYHVHGYFDSDLYGSYLGHQHDVVPVAVRSYFSDENPSACSIM
jgi:hypothetical protein